MKNKILDKVTGLLNQLYVKLFKINDTPQKVSLGFGLGVFTGIFPGTGPLAALFLALLFRVNRAAALLGSLFTNTWLSFVTFLLSIQIGSMIMGVKWQDTLAQWSGFLEAFKFADLFRLSLIRIILPVAIGYLAIGATLGLLAYLIALAVIVRIKH